jgi:hypothetical protein
MLDLTTDLVAKQRHENNSDGLRQEFQGVNLSLVDAVRQ